MPSTDERRLNWAHSVLRDTGHSDETKRRAAAIIAKFDPEGFEDHDDDPVRSRGMFD